MIDIPATVATLRAGLAEAADPERAAAMSAYLRDQFVFFGVPAPERQARQRPVFDPLRHADSDELTALVRALWAEPERELAHGATDLLRARVANLDADAVTTVEHCITTASWWDTVDALAAHVAGPLVRAHPSLADRPDAWIVGEDLWLRRTALLHQLTFGADTDADRLLAYCSACAHEREFFIRKAIGWALRQYARTDPDAVRAYLGEMGDRLSGLSRREAAKHL